MSVRKSCKTCKYMVQGTCFKTNGWTCNESNGWISWELADDAKADVLHDAEAEHDIEMEVYMEDLRVCGNCKHWIGSECDIYIADNVSEKEKACDDFEMKDHFADSSKKVDCDIMRTKCDDCIHYANRDCPVGNGNTTADHTCECAFFCLSANGGKMVSDNVNSPSHYNQGGVECIEALKAALGDKFIGFLVGNVLKYCWRYQHKNGLEDLRKAEYYLHRAIEEMSDEQPVP